MEHWSWLCQKSGRQNPQSCQGEKKNLFLWAKLFISGRGPGWMENGTRIFWPSASILSPLKCQTTQLPKASFLAAVKRKPKKPQPTRREEKKKKKQTPHTRKVVAAWIVINLFSHSLLPTSAFPLLIHPMKDQEEILLLFYSNHTYHISAAFFFVQFKRSYQMSTNLFVLDQSNYFN